MINHPKSPTKQDGEVQTVAPQQSDVKWDKSGLKEACQRGLAMGRYRQEFDLQLLLDMLLEIERLETVIVESHG